MHSDEELIDQSIALASSWQTYANNLHLEFDKEFYSIMNSIQMYPQDKILLIELIQIVFVSNNNKRMAHLMDYLLEKYGIAEFFTKTQKALLWLFQHSTKNIPDISVPFFKEYLQHETKKLLVYEDHLDEFLEGKDYQEVKTTVNLLNGMIMNELEAQRAIENYIRELGNPYVETLSVKISAIDADLDLTDFDNSVKRVVHKLTLIFRQSQKYQYKGHQKTIILDMEETTYLPIIIESFKQVLQKEEFKTVKAGLTLQAYLIDAYEILLDVLQWAKKRREAGGEKILIRLVKGSFLKKEYSNSLLKPLPLLTFTQKVHTDAQYKKMAITLLKPEYEEICDINIATHNLFDVAYLFTFAKQNAQLNRLNLEMFEGLNSSLKIAIQAQSKEVLMYSSVLLKNDFTNGIEFLLKRISDLTSQCSFLAHAYRLKLDSTAWKQYKQTFLESLKLLEKSLPQNKKLLCVHEPITDFRDVKNRVWLANALALQKRKGNSPNTLVDDGLKQFLEYKMTKDSFVDWTTQTAWLKSLIVLIQQKRHSFMFALKKDTMSNDKEISLCIDNLIMFIKQIEQLQSGYAFERKEQQLYTLYIDETFAFNDVITLIYSLLFAGHRIVIKGSAHSSSLLFAIEELFVQSKLAADSIFCMVDESKTISTKDFIEKNKKVKKAFYISDISNKELAVRTVFNSSLKHCVDYWGSITLILQEDVYANEKFLQRLMNSKNIKDKNIVFNNKQIETISVKNVKEAVELVNQNSAFMSASIESLDEEEIEYFSKECKVEHLYVNKTVECESKYTLHTKGIKKDFFLPKCDLEVLNWLDYFINIQSLETNSEMPLNPHIKYSTIIEQFELEKSIKERLYGAIKSYDKAFNKYFHLEHEYQHIEIEKNIVRFIPSCRSVIYADKDESVESLLCRIFACKTARISFSVWCQENITVQKFCEQYKGLLFDTPQAVLIQTQKELSDNLLQCDKIIASDIQEFPADVSSKELIVKTASHDGNIELNNYFYEQHLYCLIHKYGIKLDYIKANHC